MSAKNIPPKKIEKTEKLTADCRNSFSFLVKINEYTNKQSEITELREIICKIDWNMYLNHVNGVIDIHWYDFNERFKEDLLEEYPFIEDAIDASFYNPNNKQATALLLTFNLVTLPYSLYVPSECSDSVV